MGALFGTDGIRGVAGQPPLDAETIYRVGFCLAEYLKNDHPHPKVFIARDTRESGPWIESVLRQAITDAGGETRECGVVSTPAVSYLTTQNGAQAGIMISASHNPYRDNGIKIFSSEGVKFSDDVEVELEHRIFNSTLEGDAPFRARAASVVDPGSTTQSIPECSEPYTSFLRSCISPEFELDGLRVVVDCANGALSSIAPVFFGQLGADVHALHCDPNGRNINENAGSVHMEGLQEEVLSRRADLGVAFDGDADRCLFVDSQGKPKDGDDILYLLARYGDFGDGPPIVVGTVMANLGLEVALRDIGFRLVRTPVGDRYVLEEMMKLKAGIGGEQSGHIILARLAKTGDGLLTALKVIEILKAQNAGLEALCAPMVRFPQVLINIEVEDKPSLESITGLREAEALCKAKLGQDSRIVVRYSGTERLARVMVEGKDDSIVQSSARHLASVFENLVPSRK